MSLSPYQRFAEQMLHKDSVYIPKILESMINPAQAELLFFMPSTTEEISEKSDRPLAEIKSDLDDMFYKGLAFKKMKQGKTLWRSPAHIAQFHDATIVWPDATKEFIDLWRKYMNEEWPKLAPLITQLMPRPFTRVIPVNQSVQLGSVQVLAPENVMNIIDQASRLAVTKCTCRVSMQKCDSPIDVCLQINRAADYTIERRSGREVSKEEATAIIKMAEAKGLVHVTMNKSEMGHFICNCCGCCCQSFSLLISDGLRLCDPSRFAPEIDKQACTGCGTCQDRCWFHAISLDSNNISVIDNDKCMGCGICATGCPSNAIRMVEIRKSDFIPK
jgi:Pyruvate/2-oxoacid:ferredoxin oxidoreductase delta subunit